MATFKHISSKNADYGAAEQYLTFEHDEFTMKPTLDENGRLIPRDDYRISSLNCGGEDFAIACMRSNLKYGKNQKREDVKSHHYIISFDPRDAPDNGLTVDRAQALGEEFCKTHFPGHQALVSYLMPDRTKPITARKLGDDFDRAAVLEAITQNVQNAVRAAETPLPKQDSIKDRLQRNKAAINAPKNDGVQRMVDREAKRAEGKGIGYDRWAAVHNLKQMAATMSIYEESGFSSPEELEAVLAAASAGLHETTGKLKAVESTLREKKDLQKQLLAYIKTKPARDGLRAQKTEKARRVYREQHESEFIISESAARYFKAQGISKLPASKALQTEIEQLNCVTEATDRR